ncbi:hypothetical protein JI741_07410 [Chryseolinea sp. Jin1]|uniref:Phosphoribosyltransferase domain-containing protein n=2 Tax=Chryseolinea lacunae TaxID=2801331 RepID=A0ABS1KP85_9BACT|nr:hypothetical protein [Chryseolinea lacunae]
MLGARLRAYKDSDAVVVGVPPGGALTAAALAETLHLAFDVMPCRRIAHPADPTQSIASVSTHEIVLSPLTHGIPQDYVGHQIAMIRHGLDAEDRYYHDAVPRLPLKDKTVIVAEESLQSASSVMACLVGIKKENPRKVVLALSVAAPHATAAMGREVDEVVFLRVEPNQYDAFSRESTGAESCAVKERLLRLRGLVPSERT